jgi:hypothetical protein
LASLKKSELRLDQAHRRSLGGKRPNFDLGQGARGQDLGDKELDSRQGRKTVQNHIILVTKRPLWGGNLPCLLSLFVFLVLP